MDQQQKKQAQFSGAYLLLAFAALLFVQGIVAKRTAPKTVSMSELLQQVRGGQVAEVLIRDRDIVAQLKAEGDQKPERLVATRLPGIDETELVKELQEKGVEFTGFIEQASWLETFLFAWVLPIVVLGAIWFFLMRRLQGGRGGPLAIGKNKARIYDATKVQKVTFDDVAGVDVHDPRCRAVRIVEHHRIAVGDQDPSQQPGLVGDYRIAFHAQEVAQVGIWLVDDQDLAAVHLLHGEQQLRRQAEGPGHGSAVGFEGGLLITCVETEIERIEGGVARSTVAGGKAGGDAAPCPGRLQVTDFSLADDFHAGSRRVGYRHAGIFRGWGSVLALQVIDYRLQLGWQRSAKLHFRGAQRVEKVDVLLIGDGNTAAECSTKFGPDARRMAAALFRHEPFASRRTDFNVWGLCPPSAESGVARPSTGKQRRTPVGATYDAFGSERYVLTFDNRELRDVAAWAPYEFITILVNSETYGGGGILGTFATVAVDNDWADYLFVHEFGHHFAGLADEYYTSPVAYQPVQHLVEPWEANVTALLDGRTLKWGDLVAQNTPVPTPWPRQAFEEAQRGFQERRKALRARRATGPV